MRITVNGQARDIEAATVADLLATLGYGGATVATALNGDFVRATERSATALREGDAVEVVTPRQGG